MPKSEIDINVPVDDQPEIKPLIAAKATAAQTFAELRDDVRDARGVAADPGRGLREIVEARARLRELAPLIEEAEVADLEAGDRLEQAWKSMAKKLRELRERERLRRLDDMAQALHHATACLAEYGQWVDETARVTGDRPDSWGFARSLTPESIETWLAHQRAAR